MAKDDERFGMSRRLWEIISPPWLRRLQALENVANPPWLRQLEALENVANPPWLRQLEALENVANPPWLRRLQAIQQVVAPKMPHAASMEANAALLARTMMPGIAADSVASALTSVNSSVLGQSIELIARNFPGQSMLALEALSFLAGHNLRDEEADSRIPADSPFASSLVSLQDAIDASEGPDEFARKLADVVDTIILKVSSLRPTTQFARVDAATIFSFLSLVTTVIALHLANVQVKYAELAESRAQRLEREDTSNRRRLEERLTALQNAVDKLVQLDENLLSIARHSDEGSPKGQAKRYCVNSEVVLRERKDERSRRLAVLQPGTIIKVLERQRRWIRMELVDHVRERAYEGWVRKRYLTSCDD